MKPYASDLYGVAVDRTKNNVIGAMRHAVLCRLIQSDGLEPCDCIPMDDSKAMTGADVQRIFHPLPPEEAEALKATIPHDAHS
jgi:hypothetical protein